MTNQSLYIHIPFCKSKCPYCDFYSLANADLQEAYIDRCIELLPDETWRTAYIGGGTPSALAPHLLARLLGAIKCGGEFTVECNPTSVTPEFCRVLAERAAVKEGGVNRVSLGLQSAIPQERRALGRAGGVDTVKRAVEMLGIENLSLDVMLGIPGQGAESLTRTLEFCASAGAKHVSAYLLKLEPGTPFAANPPPGLPDEDAQAALYFHACGWLEEHGYAQYEISNFCLPGYESRHNLNYWECGEYYAIGPGAHGFTARRRWHYERDLEAFLRGEQPPCEGPPGPIDDGPGGDEEERAMLALRLAGGIANPTQEMRRRAAGLAGYVISDERGIRLTREGFLLSNTIIGKLLF